MTPKSVAARMEAHREPGALGGERFSGYGVVGLAFTSGRILGFRRYTASSIGPPFASIWEREPHGNWIIHTNVDPKRSCARYFGAAARDMRADDIEIRWTGPRDVTVTARYARLRLAVRLAATPATAALGAAARLLPRRVWRQRGAAERLAAAAAALLDTGRVTLTGRTPSGHDYYLQPHALWRVEAAAGVLNGSDIGQMVPLADPAALGDFRIPGRGIFAVGDALYVPPPGANGVAPAVFGRDELLRRTIMRGSAALHSGREHDRYPAE
jgi:hypothetical protein